jgi:hypothetical protein
MKKILLGSSCAAVVLSLTAVVGANQATTQTPTQSPVQSGTQGVGAPGTRTQEPATTPSTTTRSAAPANALTLTGCIERGANGEFMLSTASAGSTGATGATGTSGNSSPSVGGSISAGSQPGARASASAAMYRLSGQDFAKYVGQRVEIVGSVQPSGASSTASATSSGSSATASADRPAGGASAGASAGATTESPRAGDRASTSDSSRPAGDPSAGATRPQSSPTVGTSGAASATMQNLTVTSVKEVSGNCR